MPSENRAEPSEPPKSGPGEASWAASRLEATGLRCWSRVSLDFPDGIVVITGPNGAGKTSLVEAISLACIGASPRTARHVEVIRRGSSALRVDLTLSGPHGTSLRGIGLAPGEGGRRLTIDREPVASMRDWRAAGSLLIFLPEELRAVKGPPAARRRHLDRLLEASAPGYVGALAAYQEALLQRNALLRRVRANVTGPSSLDAWDERLADFGALVVRARRDAITRLTAPFATYLGALGGMPEGGVRLEPSPTGIADVPDAGVLDALLAGLARRRDADIRMGQTLAGPHRDDIWIGSGDADLRRVGSQGEQRTAVLALLLAQRDHIAERGGRPILILDDGLSELDPRRRAALLDALRGRGQVFLTSADPGTIEIASGRAAAVVSVRQGAIA